MKYCRKCGAQQKDSAIFCNKCGYRFTESGLATNVPDEAPAGAADAVSQDASACGTRTPEKPEATEGTAQKPEADAETRRAGKKGYAVPAAIIIALIVGVAAFFIGKGSKSPAAKNVASETEESIREETETVAQDMTEAVTEAPEESEPQSQADITNDEAEPVTDSGTLESAAIGEPQTDAGHKSQYSGNPAVRIEMSEFKDSKGDEDYMYGYTSSFIGIDKDGEKAWEIETGFQPYTDMGSSSYVIGVNDGYGYIYLDGIQKINLNDGSVIWTAPGCGGGGPSAFDDEGNLYCTAGLSSELCKIDDDGNVLSKLTSDYYIWPKNIEVSGDRVLLTFDEPYDRTLEFSKSDLSLLTYPKNRVFDEGNLFSEKERSDLNWFLDDNSNYLGIELLVDTTSDKYGRTCAEYVQDLHGYDINAGNIGPGYVILLIDNEDRVVFSQRGGSASSKYTEREIQNAQGAAVDCIKGGRGFYSAVRDYFCALGATTGF